MRKWTIAKYDGDDEYSWALFRFGKPYFTGMSKREATYEKHHYEMLEAKNAGISQERRKVSLVGEDTNQRDHRLQVQEHDVRSGVR